jgi:Zn finger protein HypA/HybF involved in hydrogenase expression
MSVERQELYCHNCGKYVQFNLDLSVDGNYKLNCPNCGHEHYRIVKDGKITDERWGQDPS